MWDRRAKLEARVSRSASKAFLFLLVFAGMFIWSSARWRNVRSR